MKMMIDAFLREFQKLAEWSKDQIGYLKRLYGISDSVVDAVVEQLFPGKTLSDLDPAQLGQVAKAITVKYGRKAAALKIKPVKGASSDITHAADRKRLLVGVKREKGALKIDLMKRILKKNRLSVKPFLGIKKEQRARRLALIQGPRAMARKATKRR